MIDRGDNSFKISIVSLKIKGDVECVPDIEDPSFIKAKGLNSKLI